jgi:hypothetical protein
MLFGKYIVLERRRADDEEPAKPAEALGGDRAWVATKIALGALAGAVVVAGAVVAFWPVAAPVAAAVGGGCVFTVREAAVRLANHRWHPDS